MSKSIKSNIIFYTLFINFSLIFLYYFSSQDKVIKNIELGIIISIISIFGFLMYKSIMKKVEKIESFMLESFDFIKYKTNIIDLKESDEHNEIEQVINKFKKELNEIYEIRKKDMHVVGEKGYISCRRKPSRKEILKYEAIYKELKDKEI